MRPSILGWHQFAQYSKNQPPAPTIFCHPGSDHGDVPAYQGNSGPDGQFFRPKMRFDHEKAPLICARAFLRDAESCHKLVRRATAKDDYISSIQRAKRFLIRRSRGGSTSPIEPSKTSPLTTANRVTRIRLVVFSPDRRKSVSASLMISSRLASS